MKSFGLVLVSLITICSASQALACAMCADIYPEVIVLDEAATQQLHSNTDLASAKELSLSEVSCVKANRYSGSERVAKCTFNYYSTKSDAALTLSGEAAVGLHSKLMTLTVESQLGGESDKVIERTGERSSPVMISQTQDKTTATIPMIHIGKLSCPKVKDVVRCEIELNTLNAVSFGD